MGKPIKALRLIGGGRVVELDHPRSVGGDRAEVLPVSGRDNGRGLNLILIVRSAKTVQMKARVREIAGKDFQWRICRDVNERFVTVPVVVRIEQIIYLIVGCVK